MNCHATIYPMEQPEPKRHQPETEPTGSKEPIGSIVQLFEALESQLIRYAKHGSTVR